MDKFLRDGGIALRNGEVRLPQNVMLTREAVSGQHLTEYIPGKTMVSQEIFGYLFSFLVPMTPEQIIDHFDTNVLLKLSNCRPGRLMTASTGERFRYVECSI